MPIGPAGQSAAAVQVAAQRIPMGVVAHVHPREPGGHAPVQSAALVQLRGPVIPPSAGGTPPSPIGIIMPAANDGSGVAWKHRGMYGKVLVST
jgi:hypothetical protein